MTSLNLKRFAVLLGIGYALSACATAGKVADAINPFNGSTENKNGITADPDRISILALNDTLQVAGTMAPSDIVLPQVYTNPDWPQTGGYANHAPQRTNAGQALTKVWSRKIGKGSNSKGRIVASPIVAGGQIFTVDGANRLTAMDAGTGQVNWTYSVSVKSTGRTRKGKTRLVDRIKDPFILGDKGGSDKEAVGGGIAYADGRIFMTSGFGVVAALDAVTGAEIWRRRTRIPMHSAPAVENGRLFAVSDDNELFAFDADSGDTLWTYQGITETARMLTAPAPAIVGDVVVAPFSSGEIVALRVQNGSILWQDALDASGNLTPLSTLNDIAAGPVVVDGYVFVSAQSGTFAAFDLRTGQRVWTQPAGSLSFPMVAGDFVYTVTTEGELVCMSKADGTVIWLTQLQAFKKQKSRKKRIAWSGPVMAGDRLLLMGSNGQAVLVNPYSGEQIRTFGLGDPVYVSPIVANDTVYYVTDGGQLVALR